MKHTDHVTFLVQTSDIHASTEPKDAPRIILKSCWRTQSSGHDPSDAYNHKKSPLSYKPWLGKNFNIVKCIFFHFFFSCTKRGVKLSIEFALFSLLNGSIINGTFSQRLFQIVLISQFQPAVHNISRHFTRSFAVVQDKANAGPRTFSRIHFA